MEYNGSASLIGVSTLTLNGGLVTYTGSAHLAGSGSLIIEGAVPGTFSVRGSAHLVGTSTLTCNGEFITVGQRIDELQVRVTQLEEDILLTPEGTDFLTPEDIQPLFNEREVIFDV